MMPFFEPADKIEPKHLDLERARQSLREELEAINYYQERIDATPDESLKRILEHNMNEEKEHAAMLMECAPISVEVRTSFATANERWNIWCRLPPSVPAVSASRTACFIWPRICGSPSTIESSPEATRKAWRAASRCSSR